MRLDYQILPKSSPPNLTGWICPWCSSGFQLVAYIAWLHALHVAYQQKQHVMCDMLQVGHSVSNDLGLEVLQMDNFVQRSWIRLPFAPNFSTPTKLCRGVLDWSKGYQTKVNTLRPYILFIRGIRNSLHAIKRIWLCSFRFIIQQLISRIYISLKDTNC